MTTNIVKHKRSLCGRMRRLSIQMLAACGIFVGTAMMQSCDKDILEGQPDWLGNSIYERLQEGITTTDGSHKSFNYTLRLIDDLNYTSVLSQTGSRTLFVAPDEKYEGWFKNNAWGVRRYEDLTDAQKKDLFNGTMIRNAYLLELMSNVPSTADNKDPETGMCMRRETARSIYDNVPVMKLEDFPVNNEIEDDPVNAAWNIVRNNGRDINILQDATTAPMIHFLPSFMKKNNIVGNDLKVVSNGSSESVEDSWVNGRKVISSEQTCKNGYVYVVDSVMDSNPNMAQIISSNPETSLFANLLRRYSVPVRLSNAQQQEFWRLFPQYDKVDSLYQLRYLNMSGNHGLATPTGNSEDNLASGLLKFDPGWNQYKADNGNVIMQNDCAAMLVPTNEALEKWFSSEGGGKALMEKFGSWDKIPYTTLSKLINVNMLESFVGTVPSKFLSILDDAQRSMNVSEEDIVKCYMGCNGVVYVTNKVFTPSEYASVLFPALTQETDNFATAYHALTSAYTSGYVTSNGSAKDFQPYLSAMDSRFTLIIPFNKYTSQNASVKYPVFRYVDPCSYGLPQQIVYEFYFDTKSQKVLAYAYKATTQEDGTVVVDDYSSGKAISDAEIIANRLYDLIDNSIIIEDVVPGKKYYKTKAGSMMYVADSGSETTFKGGYQLVYGQEVKVNNETSKYDMRNADSEGKASGNGVTYGVSGNTELDPYIIDIPMTSPKSVYDVLKAEAERTKDETDLTKRYTLFYDLLYDQKAGLYGTKDGTTNFCANYAGNRNLTLFDNYNYTVYLPSDADIQKMIDNFYLPTWDDYENASTEEEKEKIKDKICSFLRYHVQDNSVYVGGDVVKDQPYETSLLNKKNNRFYTLKLTQDGSQLLVKDNVNGEPRKVLTSEGCCNIPCREYWLNKEVNSTTTTKLSYTAKINSSSHAVIHKIDGVLLYDQSQTNNWHY